MLSGNAYSNKHTAQEDETLNFINTYLVRLLMYVIRLLIILLSKLIKKHKHGVRFNWKIGAPVNKQPNKEERIMSLELNCTNEQKIKVTVVPVTLSGKAAQIQAGSLSVLPETGNGTVEFIDAEPNAFFVVSGDEPGDTSFIVSADADLGDGIVLVQDVIVLKVAGALAINLGLVAEAPIQK